jgi:NAD(P)-dependent dehydrogenase (short-subunit alcohol dehydrogenase family)
MANKLALVFGGSRGIGAACVQTLAGRGFDVAYTYVSRAPDSAPAPGAKAYRADVGAPAEVTQAFADAWYTISTAKGVPAEIVNRLNAEINVALKSPDLAQRWETLGVLPLGGTPQDAVNRNRTETERWSKVIESAGLRAD